jgi:hypothetical protein
MTILLIALLVAAVAVVGGLSVRYGADTRPGFDEQFEPRIFGHDSYRQVPGV